MWLQTARQFTLLHLQSILSLSQKSLFLFALQVSRIGTRHLLLGIRGDDMLDKLFKGITIAEAGVRPHIHQALLASSKNARKFDAVPPPPTTNSNNNEERKTATNKQQPKPMSSPKKKNIKKKAVTSKQPPMSPRQKG